MFPVTSKRFASSVNVAKQRIFGQVPVQAPVNVARLPDMDAIERNSASTLSIPSMPDSYTASTGSSFPVLRPSIEVVAAVAPGAVSSTGSAATH
ncbi:hypothetical protein JCM5353_000465 [Sporobolomyces roseus]